MDKMNTIVKYIYTVDSTKKGAKTRTSIIRNDPIICSRISISVREETPVKANKSLSHPLGQDLIPSKLIIRA